MSYHLLVSSPRVGHHNYRLITPRNQEHSPQYDHLLTRLDQEVRNRLGPISKVYESELILAISYDAQQLKGRWGSEVLILCAEHEPSARPLLLAALENLKPVIDELIKRSEVIEQAEHTNIIYSEWLYTQLQAIPALQALVSSKTLLDKINKQINISPPVPTKPRRELKFNSRAIAVIAILFATVMSIWLSQDLDQRRRARPSEIADEPKKPEQKRDNEGVEKKTPERRPLMH